MRRRLTALLFLLCLSPVVQADALPSVALYYGAQPPLAELRAFDAAVTDPDQPGAQPAAAAGHADFAYVSLGEVQPFRPWFPELPSAWLGGENKAWGSRLVDPAAPGWADFVADRIVAPLWARGYRGFFLDTLDSYRLLPGGDADRQRREDGLVAVIRRIKQRWPEARLILNRGFEILPRVRPGVLIHLHDIFLPFDYPSEWIFKDGRTWNEQYVLRAFLMNNPRYQIEIANRYLWKHHRANVERLYAGVQSALGCSLWMSKV